MKITKRQLRRIIREAIGDQLPYNMGGPWVDKNAPVGKGAKEYDDLDTELTDKEIEASMGWKPAGDEEVFWKEGDLVRKVDYRGDGWGGDYKKTVGEDIGTVIEIDDSEDGPIQYVVNWSTGEPTMVSADELELVNENKTTRRQLRRIIKEASQESAKAHAKMQMLEILDVGVQSVIGPYLMAKGVGEMLGRNAGHVLDMDQAAPILDLDPDYRVELYRELITQLHERSVIWESLKRILQPRDYNNLIKQITVQFEAELRKR